jgi:hypothetical protein
MCALKKVLLGGLMALVLFGAVTPLYAARPVSNPTARIDWLIEDPTPPKPGGNQSSIGPAGVPPVTMFQVIVSVLNQMLYGGVWIGPAGR